MKERLGRFVRKKAKIVKTEEFPYYIPWEEEGKN